MAIKFSGEFEVRKDPEKVYGFLTNANAFAALLSNPKDLTIQDDRHFTVKAKVDIFFIKKTADMQMEMTESRPPSHARFKGHTVIAGQNLIVIGSFDLTPISLANAVRTQVKWQGNVEIAGTLASLAGNLLEPIGKIWIQKIIDDLQRAMALFALLKKPPIANQSRENSISYSILAGAALYRCDNQPAFHAGFSAAEGSSGS